MSDLDGDTLDALQSHLEANAVGRANAIVSDDLAAIIDAHDSHDTNPSVRAACRALMAERQVPVAGGPQGMFIPAPDEFDAVKQSIRDQIGSLNERLILLREAREAYAYGDSDAADAATCEACEAAIDGDPWLWHSYELCRACHDAAPGLSEATEAFVEAGGVEA